ncbi:MAG: N-acetylmuramic acid 6-phosphate etherase [Flavobacteriaceae bacterium]|nr:N-acetylmuramic acid 6-phosphate etherase [Flavobacteriaceae bacterium]
MKFEKTSEAESLYSSLDQMSSLEILQNINKEDQKVSIAVNKAIPNINTVVGYIVDRLQNGGRLIYIGAGTSGRLGVLDASECPPTYGVSSSLVQGIIAGGDKALKISVENAEDSKEKSVSDLKNIDFNSKDTLIGIAASGTTPYVISAIEYANKLGAYTGGITVNTGSPLSEVVKCIIEIEVGPEFVTGSSRMKAGTAQKMVLNMISTSVMILIGKVKGNKMVNMKLSNDKLVKRAVGMLVSELNISIKQAEILLSKHHNVNKAIEGYRKNK